MKLLIIFLIIFLKIVWTNGNIFNNKLNSELKFVKSHSNSKKIFLGQRNDSEMRISEKDLAPIVYTKSGLVQGVKNQTEGLKMQFYLYMGIPYAEPPVGFLRFKPPVPVKPWQNLLLAFKEGNKCIQKPNLLKKTIIGDENCLFLNIYTPEIKPNDAKLPVMFWIHGGDYFFGSGNRDTYGSDYLIEKNVIVVTHNYRLGPLGFLSFNTSDAPGNIGVKDSILALKWIHANIENFGGDPNKITIFGESAGAASVHLLILSPMAKGLFRAAILESGDAITRWAISFDHARVAHHLAKSLGIKDKDPSTIITKLQEKNVNEIILKALNVKFFLRLGINLMNYVPWNICVEYKHSNAVISDLPYSIMMNKAFNKVPMIFGYNSREGLAMLSVAKKGSLRHAASKYGFITPGLEKNLNKTTKKEVQKLIKKRYYPQTLFPDNNTFIDLVTVTDFINPIHQSAWLISNNSNENIYLYKFGYQGNISVRNYLHLNESIEGDPHAEELGYLWRPFAIEQNPDDRDKLARERIVTLFTNFAKNLNPNPLPSTNIHGVWKPLGTEHNYLNFSDDLIPDVKPNWDDIVFWKGLYDNYGKPPYLNY